jgi:hypothetical protein
MVAPILRAALQGAFFGAAMQGGARYLVGRSLGQNFANREGIRTLAAHAAFGGMHGAGLSALGAKIGGLRGSAVQLPATFGALAAIGPANRFSGNAAENIGRMGIARGSRQTAIDARNSVSRRVTKAKDTVTGGKTFIQNRVSSLGKAFTQTRVSKKRGGAQDKSVLALPAPTRKNQRTQEQQAYRDRTARQAVRTRQLSRNPNFSRDTSDAISIANRAYVRLARRVAA